MRHYALERLQAAGEVDATRSKHLRWYSRLGVSAEADSFSPRLPRVVRSAGRGDKQYPRGSCNTASRTKLTWMRDWSLPPHSTFGWQPAPSPRRSVRSNRCSVPARQAIARGREPCSSSATSTCPPTIRCRPNQFSKKRCRSRAPPGTARLIAEILANQALGHVFSGALDCARRPVAGRSPKPGVGNIRCPSPRRRRQNRCLSRNATG